MTKPHKHTRKETHAPFHQEKFIKISTTQHNKKTRVGVEVAFELRMLSFHPHFGPERKGEKNQGDHHYSPHHTSVICAWKKSRKELRRSPLPPSKTLDMNWFEPSQPKENRIVTGTSKWHTIVTKYSLFQLEGCHAGRQRHRHAFKVSNLFSLGG